jgi:hypothetical protein
MGVGGFRNDGTFERRIGRRAPAADIPVTWVVPRKATFTVKRSPRLHEGHIHNVSLTGAAIAGPPDMEVEVGDIVIIRWDGLDSSVRVRHVGPSGEPGLTTYGVELEVVHPQLKREIIRTLDERSAPH